MFFVLDYNYRSSGSSRDLENQRRSCRMQTYYYANILLCKYIIMQILLCKHIRTSSNSCVRALHKSDYISRQGRGWRLPVLGGSRPTHARTHPRGNIHIEPDTQTRGNIHIDPSLSHPEREREGEGGSRPSHARTHARAPHARTHARTQTRRHTHTSTRIQTHRQEYSRARARTHARTHEQTHIPVHTQYNRRYAHAV